MYCNKSIDSSHAFPRHVSGSCFGGFVKSTGIYIFLLFLRAGGPTAGGNLQPTRLGVS